MKTEDAEVDACMIAAGEPVFHVVYVFDPMCNEFVERGIYTREADALEHQTRHREATGSEGLEMDAHIVRRTFGQLCHGLAQKRLGPLAKVLAEQFGKAPDEPETIVSLWGPKSTFPIAVARRVEG